MKPPVETEPHVSQSVDAFRFGRNWQHYVERHLSPERIAIAQESLTKLVGEGLDAGERELYPGGRRPGQDRRQVIGGHGIGPDQALGLGGAPEDPAGPGHRVQDLWIADRRDRHDRGAGLGGFGGHAKRLPR